MFVCYDWIDNPVGSAFCWTCRIDRYMALSSLSPAISILLVTSVILPIATCNSRHAETWLCPWADPIWNFRAPGKLSKQCTQLTGNYTLMSLNTASYSMKFARFRVRNVGYTCDSWAVEKPLHHLNLQLIWVFHDFFIPISEWRRMGLGALSSFRAATDMKCRDM